VRANPPAPAPSYHHHTGPKPCHPEPE